jgi:hypothetical protein
VFPRGHDRVVAVGRLTDDPEIRLLLQQTRHCGADAVVVVGDDDGDLTAKRGRHPITLPHSGPICRDACAPLV